MNIWAIGEKGRLFWRSLVAKPRQLTTGPMNVDAPAPVAQTVRSFSAVGAEHRGETDSLRRQIGTSMWLIFRACRETTCGLFHGPAGWPDVAYPEVIMWRSKPRNGSQRSQLMDLSSASWTTGWASGRKKINRIHGLGYLASLWRSSTSSRKGAQCLQTHTRSAK